MTVPRRLRWLVLPLLGLAAVLAPWSPTDPAAPALAPPAPHACGAGAPADAVPISLPVASTESWYALAGTLVCFTHDLTVTGVYELGLRGELLLADRRLFGENTGLEVADEALHRIRLGTRQRSAAADVWPLPWGLSVGEVRVGDAVVGLLGRIWPSEAGGYVLEPNLPPTFEIRNPRPPDPEPLEGDLRIAAFNLDNFFLQPGGRGGDHPAAIARQQEKLVAALARLDADVLALLEIERDEGEALSFLAAALNARLEAEGGDDARRYRALPEAPASAGRPGDAVRQGFLIDPATVEVLALHADPRPVFERAPQALTLQHRASGEVLTVIAVHLRSKSRCPSSGDVDRGFGCWNLRRTAQAEALLGFARRLKRELGDPDVLLLGDINAHRFEPPMAVFEADDVGWSILTDLLPPERAVSYVFSGRSAALDHALASPSLAPRVGGVTYWAINADEPPLAGPGRGAEPPPGYRPDPYRSSDHDPLLVALALGP